jgi:predicted deacylase
MATREWLGVRATPGEVVYGSFDVDGVRIPLVLAAGESDGPTLVIHCAQHPTEYSGSAMIGLLLRELDLAALRGTIAIVPLSNLPFIVRTREPDAFAPQADSLRPAEGTPRTNINRCWPGVQDGTWNERLAYVLAHQLFAKADAVLDYHSCRMCDPNFTSYIAGHTQSRHLALAFGFVAIDEMPVQGEFPGQLHSRIPDQLGVPAILIEMAPTSRIVQHHRALEAKAGATNILRHLGMLDGAPRLPPIQIVFHRRGEQIAFRARNKGFASFYLPEAAPVTKGTLIADVRSLHDFSVIERHIAPCDGGLGSCGTPTSQLVLPGDELATLQPGAEIVRNPA